MSRSKLTSYLGLLAGLTCMLLGVPATAGQTEPQDKDDVVRVYTQLVQTDLMVFDAKGRPVNGLKRENFELKVDGKITPIEFLEYVVSGSAREEAQLAAARAGRIVSIPADASERGRTVLFYVDDLHLDLASCNAARRVIAKFVDQSMAYNTRAAITSTSGQIGFLQQLTDSEIMLRAALRRLNPKPFSVEDGMLPRMSEHEALMIDRRDPELTGYFVDETVKINRGMKRDTAEAIITQRASNTLFIAARATRDTLTGLENLLTYANQSPGRKLLIFISGGFVLDLSNSNEAEITQRIANAAARSGVVIYSVDARGLVPAIRDASRGGGSDPTQRLDRAIRSEVFETQDIMSALARDTGGKTVFNTNDLTSGLQTALRETSVYYLLGWKPDSGATVPSKSQKITATVIGRPDLTVRVRRSFAGGEPLPAIVKSADKKAPPPLTGPEGELQKGVLAPFAGRNTQISIALNYANTSDQGMTLSTSLEIDRSFVSVPADDQEKQSETIEIAGTIYDDHGRAGAKISDRLTVTPESVGGSSTNAIVATYPIRIRPGLYQVRVAVRDEKTGRVGSTNAWVEVPDLLAPKLALSSLMIGERKPEGSVQPAVRSDVPDAVSLTARLRFSPASQLRFLLFAYNARLAAATAAPNVAIQIEILRAGQAIFSPPLRTIPTTGVADLKRLAYAAELPLAGLERGHYLLKVTAYDRVARTTATEQRAFDIE